MLDFKAVEALEGLFGLRRRVPTSVRVLLKDVIEPTKCVQTSTFVFGVLYFL